MDALALLCTLHAEGPSTLKRLHAAGCRSLAEIESAGHERLAQILDLPPAGARRFLREARNLEQRMGQPSPYPGLEPEDEPGSQRAPALTVAAPALAETASGMATEMAATELPDSEPAPAPHLTQHDRDLVRQVLGRWAERDEAQTPGNSSAHPINDELATLDPNPELTQEPSFRPQAIDEPIGEVIDEPAVEPNGETPTPAVTASVGHPLRQGEIEGLDAERCRGLLMAGVTTLEELVALEDADTLELCRSVGLGFTGVLRLQTLARRRLSDAESVFGRSVTARAPVPVVSGPVVPVPVVPVPVVPVPVVPGPRHVPLAQASKFSVSEAPIGLLYPVPRLDRELELKAVESPRKPHWSGEPAPGVSGENAGGPFA